MRAIISGFKGYEKETRDQTKWRLRKKVCLCLEQLTVLAQKLPEKDLEKIFNRETLIPFLESIFERETNYRLLELSYYLVSLLDKWGRNLETHQYLVAGEFELSGLKAIKLTKVVKP